MLDPYDSVRYPSFPRNQSHPAYVSALALIAGVELPPIERWRVLEIGCGTASNIIPLACDYPEAEFVGIDRAHKPLEEGRALAADLHLANLRLEAVDLLEWNPIGSFDYIIAHGFYSWVPLEVRERLFQICARMLTPLGVAFISYNALPGCYFRKFTRDLLRFHARHETDPARRIQKAREMAQIMADIPGDDALQPGIRNEFETLLKRDPTALYHDDLAEISEPFYLLEFAAAAAKHGLQYLGDADPIRDDIQGLPALSEDWLESRQYMDFLARRRFRETLLCRQGVAMERRLSLERMGRLFVSCRMRAGEIKEDGTQTFHFPDSGVLTTNHPLAKQLLETFSAAWPQCTQLEKLSLDPYSESAAELVVRLVSSKALEIRTIPPIIAESLSERPEVSSLAREQIARGYPMVTNQRHLQVELNDSMIRTLLSLLDGSRDRSALIRELVKSGSDPGSAEGMLNNALLEGYRMSMFIR